MRTLVNATRVVGILVGILIMAALVPFPREAFAQDFSCGGFRRNIGGSWSTQRRGTIQGPKGAISLMRDRTFGPGTYYQGVNVAALLEQECRGRAFVSSAETSAPEVPCGAFRRTSRGWSALRRVTIHGPEEPIALMRGKTLRPGRYYKGVDLGNLLEQQCR